MGDAAVITVPALLDPDADLTRQLGRRWRGAFSARRPGRRVGCWLTPVVVVHGVGDWWAGSTWVHR